MDKTFKESQGFFDLIIGPVTVCFFFHSYLTESKHTRGYFDIVFLSCLVHLYPQNSHAEATIYKYLFYKYISITITVSCSFGNIFMIPFKLLKKFPFQRPEYSL